MPYQLGHIYVALHHNKSPGYIVGNLFPDVTHLIIKDKKHVLMRSFLKYLEENNKANKEFIEGIKMHIYLDAYLHKNLIYPKKILLMKEFNLHESTAEGYIEMALDRLLAKKYPQLSIIMRKAAKKFDTHPYAIELAKVLNKPRKKILKVLRDSKRIAILRKPYTLRTLLVKGLILRKYSRLRLRELNLVKSRRIMKRAEFLIKQDYQRELDKAIKAIGKSRKAK